MAKTVTHYLFERGHCNQLQSKLHKAIDVYLTSHDRKLIEASKIKELQQTIINEVEQINAKYSRCKAVNIRFEKYGFRDTMFIKGIEALTYYLKSCTLVEPENFKQQNTQ